MPYNAETYLEIKRRLSDWLRVTGGDVPVLPLDLLNRAQNTIQEENIWSKQLQDVEMSAVDGEEKPRVMCMPGGSLSDSELWDGVVVNKTFAQPMSHWDNFDHVHVLLLNKSSDETVNNTFLKSFIYLCCG